MSISTGKIKPSRKSPKRLRSSIKKDAVKASDYNRFKLPWSCDDCTHFNSENETCTLGYNANNHRRAQQQFDYELGGHFALCRFQEID
jgi:hypothetical protein